MYFARVQSKCDAYANICYTLRYLRRHGRPAVERRAWNRPIRLIPYFLSASGYRRPVSSAIAHYLPPLNNKSCRTSCSWLLCQQNASISISCRRLSVFELGRELVRRRQPRDSAQHRETTFSARIFQSSTANPRAALSQSAAHCSRMGFRRATG